HVRPGRTGPCDGLLPRRAGFRSHPSGRDPRAVIVRLPRDAAVDIWAVASDGRRLTGAAQGEVDVPDGAVLEVRGRRRANAKLAWLTELSIPVVSVDVRRSQVSALDLVAAASLPHLAVLTAAGE